jgi:CBS domain containing-hemolysin-like protein
MIAFACILFAVSVAMSAFFSGTETGFYRASRVKMVMNAIEGDRLSKFLVLLANHPALMVATALLGNNIANYLLSLSVLLFVNEVFEGDIRLAELLAPLLLTPFLFVYGEALPKTLFYQAPNRLLRYCAFPLAIVTIIFAPASAVLWGLSRVIERFFGQAPVRVRAVLARKELQQILDEGQQVGILHPSQRILSQNFFSVASTPVRQICTPMNRLHSVPLGKSLPVAIRYAQRFGLLDIPISNAGQTEILGYVPLVQLLVANDPKGKLKDFKPLMEIRADEPLAEALLRMQSSRETLARVVNVQRHSIGLVSLNQLSDPLLRGPLGSLQR